jgi:hypothetical protein
MQKYFFFFDLHQTLEARASLKGIHCSGRNAKLRESIAECAFWSFLPDQSEARAFSSGRPKGGPFFRGRTKGPGARIEDAPHHP